MGADSEISWTHHTFNPWWGCTRVSPGCEHCYAESFAKRVGQKVWGVQAERRFFGDKHWAEPLKWNASAAKAGERHRVFCASMADVFEDRADLIEPRARLWRLIMDTTHLDWLLPTKRPENMVRMVPWTAVRGAAPWANVWVGTTVEDQRRADERIPHLLRTPAAVRFLSCEPLLERVRLDNGESSWLSCTQTHDDPDADPCCVSFADHGDHFHGIDWVIVGGESGHGARPCALEWIEGVVRKCRSARVPVFVKQLGACVVSEERTYPIQDMAAVTGKTVFDFKNHRASDGTVWAWRAGLRDKKGGDPAEWPEDLRVREFPAVHP